MARSYQLRRRAERQDQTRQRIVDVAIDMHKTVGSAGTTVTEIAQRAGVGRVTVYRHFPDELALFRACSGHYFEQHPLPDIARWRAIGDRAERLRTALNDAYAYHRDNEAMMARALAEVRDHEIMEPYHAYWRQAGEAVAAAWQARGRRRELLRAAIIVALSFDTWRALVKEQGLTQREAVDVASRLVGSNGAPTRKTPAPPPAPPPAA